MHGAHGHVVGDNVQGCVDAQHHLLVCTQVTQSVVDQGQLASVAQAAKAQLGVTHADGVADGGNYKSEDSKTCQEIGLEPHLPTVEDSPSERAGLFGKSDIRYEPEREVDHYPNGAQLRRRRRREDQGRLLFNYAHPPACRGCALKARCPQAADRTISRWEHKARLERRAAAVAASPDKLAADRPRPRVSPDGETFGCRGGESKNALAFLAPRNARRKLGKQTFKTTTSFHTGSVCRAPGYGV